MMATRRIKLERLVLKAGQQLNFEFPDGSKIMVTVERIGFKSVTLISEAFQPLKD